MSVATVCRRGIVCIEPDRSLREAAELMRSAHVGALIVVEREPEQRRPLGMLTDRDIVVEAAAAGVDLDAVTVGDAMTADPLTVAESDSELRVIGQMRAQRVRRVPVVDAGGQAVAVLSVDDLLDTLAEALSDLAWLTMNEREQERQRRP